MLSKARSRESEVCRGGRGVERVDVGCKSDARWCEDKLDEHVRRGSEQ